MPATAETATYAVYISNYFNGTREITNETVMQTIPMDDGEIENSLISGVVKTEMGKAGSFEFSIPIGHPFYNALQPMRTMIRVEFYGAEIFRGRVLTVGKEMYGTRAVHCEGAFAFFLDSHQEGSKEETRTEVTVLQYLERLINNHNADVTEGWKRVMLGDVPGNYASYVLDEQKVAIPADKAKQKFGNTSWDTTMDRLEDLLNQFGGYFRLRPVKEGEYYSGDLTQVGTSYVPDGGTGLLALAPSGGGLTARGVATDADVIQRNHDTKETFGAVLDWFENYYTHTPNQHLGDNIAAGKNLLDLKGEPTVDNLFTVVIPIGKKDSDDVFIADYWPTAYEGHAKVNYIEVPELVTKNLYTDAQLTAHPFHKVSEYENAISKYGRIYKIVEFENANTPEKLFNYAKEWIKENYTPELVQWDVTALDLRIINSAHPAIFTGDRIALTHPEVVTTYSSFTVISAEYDIYNPEKNKYKIGIPNQTINASYGVKNKKSKKSKPDGPSSSTPNGDPEEAKEEIERLKSQLRQRYSLKTDWHQDITYDDPLAFTVFDTNGDQLSAKDAAKKMGSIITELMRTKVSKAGELLTQALQRGCAKDDVQLLIDNTPSVKSMQNAWKGSTQTYMVGQLGLTSQEAEVLTNQSAGSSWLAALVDDDGNWSELAISKGYAGAGNSKLKQQAIATRKILNGTESPPGANVIQNTVDQVVGNNLFLGSFLQADSDTESMGIGNDGDGGWNINLNLPFSYDLDGHTYNVPSGTVSAQDFNIREVPSFATKFAMIDDLIANCVTTNELNAALARIGTIEARYVTAESMKSMSIYAQDFIFYGYHGGNISLKNALKTVSIRDNGNGTSTLMYMSMLDTQMTEGETFSRATTLSGSWNGSGVFTVTASPQGNQLAATVDLPGASSENTTATMTIGLYNPSSSTPREIDDPGGGGSDPVPDYSIGYTLSMDEDYVYLKRDSNQRVVARIDNVGSGAAVTSGWYEAYQMLRIPTSSPSEYLATMTIQTPASSPTGGLYGSGAETYTYTVAVTDVYAEIRYGNAVVARTSNPAYRNGWRAAYNRVSTPTSEPSSYTDTLNIQVPASDYQSGIQGSGADVKTYTVTANNTYAEIRYGSAVVARASNPAYGNGWYAAYQKVSTPTSEPSSYTDTLNIQVPASSSTGGIQGSGAEVKTYTVTANNTYAEIRYGSNVIARASNPAYGNGWYAAYQKVSVPTSEPSSYSNQLNIQVPASSSTGGIQGSGAEVKTYTVAATSEYAEIRYGNVTVARTTNTAYSQAWASAYSTVSVWPPLGANDTRNTFYVQVPAQTIDTYTQKVIRLLIDETPSSSGYATVTASNYGVSSGDTYARVNIGNWYSAGYSQCFQDFWVGWAEATSSQQTSVSIQPGQRLTVYVKGKTTPTAANYDDRYVITVAAASGSSDYDNGYTAGWAQARAQVSVWPELGESSTRNMFYVQVPAQTRDTYTQKVIRLLVDETPSSSGYATVTVSDYGYATGTAYARVAIGSWYRAGWKAANDSESWPTQDTSGGTTTKFKVYRASSTVDGQVVTRDYYIGSEANLVTDNSGRKCVRCYVYYNSTNNRIAVLDRIVNVSDLGLNSMSITRAQTGASASGVPSFGSGTLYYLDDNDGQFHSVASGKYWYYSSTAVTGTTTVYR